MIQRSKRFSSLIFILQKQEKEECEKNNRIQKQIKIIFLFIY